MLFRIKQKNNIHLSVVHALWWLIFLFLSNMIVGIKIRILIAWKFQ